MCFSGTSESGFLQCSKSFTKLGETRTKSQKKISSNSWRCFASLIQNKDLECEYIGFNQTIIFNWTCVWSFVCHGLAHHPSDRQWCSVNCLYAKRCVSMSFKRFPGESWIAGKFSCKRCCRVNKFFWRRERQYRGFAEFCDQRMGAG